MCKYYSILFTLCMIMLTAGCSNPPKLLDECHSPDGRYSAKMLIGGRVLNGSIEITDSEGVHSRTIHLGSYDEESDMTTRYARFKAFDFGFEVLNRRGETKRKISWDNIASK